MTAVMLTWVRCPAHKPTPQRDCPRCRKAVELNADQLRRLGRPLTPYERSGIALSTHEMYAAAEGWAALALMLAAER